MKWWKALGVAAFVGVAATGVAIARSERQRRAYTPEQVRERLHARVAEVGQAESERDEEFRAGGGTEGGPSRGLARRVRSGVSKAGARVAELPPVATIGRLVRRRARGGTAGER